jgi:hypothetical protein
MLICRSAHLRNANLSQRTSFAMLICHSAHPSQCIPFAAHTLRNANLSQRTPFAMLICRSAHRSCKNVCMVKKQYAVESIIVIACMCVAYMCVSVVYCIYTCKYYCGTSTRTRKRTHTHAHTHTHTRTVRFLHLSICKEQS